MQGSCIVHWSAELITEQDGKEIVQHGHAHDISLTEVNVFTDEILNSHGPVTLVLRIPKGRSIQEWGTVRAICRLVIAVEEGDHFRIQLHFQSFIGDGKQVLENALRERKAFTGSQ